MTYFWSASPRDDDRLGAGGLLLDRDVIDVRVLGTEGGRVSAVDCLRVLEEEVCIVLTKSQTGIELKRLPW